MPLLCLLQDKRRKKCWGRLEKKASYFGKRKKLFCLAMEITLSLLFLFLNAVGQFEWKSHQGICSFFSVACGTLIFPCLSQQAENTTRKFSRGWRLQPWYLLFQNFIPSPEGLWKCDMFLLHVDLFWEHVSFKSKRIFLISAICPAVLSIQKLVSTFEW